MVSLTRVALASFVSCALLLGCMSDPDLVANDDICSFATVNSLRLEWRDGDDLCRKKLPFELWTLMKAEGSAQNVDAQYVLESCIQSYELGLLELITPEGYTMSDAVEAAPGDVVSETMFSTTYSGATAASLEAFCGDDNITQVTRVQAVAYNKHRSKTSRRRLQTTTSEAGQAHQVAELITGLKDLGCTRTTGEDQIMCVMSDSFDRLGNASGLQAFGDLPAVDVVKERPVAPGQVLKDEGSAMIELAFDIASGATFKFNTAFAGQQAFADDIAILATVEECDVIVDDVRYRTQPAFRDGVISQAVDAAVDSGTLYFTAAGNDGTGWRFDAAFECSTLFDPAIEFTSPACGGNAGLSMHVFQSTLPPDDPFRYLFEIPDVDDQTFGLHWDEDIGTDQDIFIIIYLEDVEAGVLFFFTIIDQVSGGAAVEWGEFDPLTTDGYRYYIQLVHDEPGIDDLSGGFLLISSEGIDGQSDGSVYGHGCAASAVSVAPMAFSEGGGVNGAFEDPETGSVEVFSSRGPCIINGDTRQKPTTCAADALSTSTPGFANFLGASAASPVAAAIATIVRAACFPKVVGFAEIMEMLTNYDYTIDYTSDAGGAPETWGIEAGHGVVSASQMLGWVQDNCREACAFTADDESADTPFSFSFSFDLDLDWDWDDDDISDVAMTW